MLSSTLPCNTSRTSPEQQITNLQSFNLFVRKHIQHWVFLVQTIHVKISGYQWAHTAYGAAILHLATWHTWACEAFHLDLFSGLCSSRGVLMQKHPIAKLLFRPERKRHLGNDVCNYRGTSFSPLGNYRTIPVLLLYLVCLSSFHRRCVSKFNFASEHIPRGTACPVLDYQGHCFLSISRPIARTRASSVAGSGVCDLPSCPVVTLQFQNYPLFAPHGVRYLDKADLFGFLI
ncbi:hypothetical protein B0O99DRAFT_76393 [Bisporella sp. PMI_857]|nr:hypothetical protein B0O99DRAFT_76393 [Bisporella sp. PMI_857]